MHEPVPPELVDMIIDNVGSGHKWVRRPPLEEDCTCITVATTYETLKNCALVARSWTYRSHKNLFKGIVFVVDEGEEIHDLVLPSPASLEFVESLAIYLTPQVQHRGSITLHLLKAFSVCPLKSLQIEGGIFSLDRRSGLRACFDALSGHLLGLTFRFCLFEPEPLRDILAIENTDANIMFLGCDQDYSEDPARNGIDWQLVQHNMGRSLCVMGGEDKPSEEFLIDLSMLSVQFARLEVDFYEDGEFIDATQSLINANAGMVSFLKLNVISDMSTNPQNDLDALLPPGLAQCVNLSELVLNMKGSYSCIVGTPGYIFATLLRANPPNLSKITVQIEDARTWFLADNREECADSWNDLDSTLAMLAHRSTSARGKNLVFVMEVTCMNGTVHRAKRWLPRLLPRFDEEGSLHVHDGEDDGCDRDDYDEEDEGACMGRAVLKKYEYVSESDEETEEADAAEPGKENTGNQEGEEAKGSEEGEKVEELDEGNKSDDVDEDEDEEI